MSTQLIAKKVDFKFGIYISQAIDLMKNNFGTVFLAFIFAMIMSIIPFCGLMAFGNFYKICYKLDKGIPVKAEEVFNFDDFMPYLLFQLYLFAAFALLFIPMIFLGAFLDKDGSGSAFGATIAVIYFIAAYFVVIYLILQAFYIPALITFKKMTDIKAAFNISKVMTKGNLWQIFFFSMATSFLSQLGIIACFVGVFITAPFYYVAHYFTCKDGLTQIEHDEIIEIGQNY